MQDEKRNIRRLRGETRFVPPEGIGAPDPTPRPSASRASGPKVSAPRIPEVQASSSRPGMTYNREARRLMNKFDEDLELHTNTESWFGRNATTGRVKFVPKEFLANYWTPTNLNRLLHSLPGPKFAKDEISQISSEYIVVFSILTKLHRPDQIRHFLVSQIKDSSLPLHDASMPKVWTDQLQDRVSWNSFFSEQWRFCPYVFGNTSDTETTERCILPIQSKERLQNPATEDNLAVLYKIKIHPACRGELSVSQQ
jgi:hypothetical protein